MGTQAGRRNTFRQDRLLRLALVALIIVTRIVPIRGQIRLESTEELKRALAVGDVVTVVPAGGEPVVGRIVRIGAADVEIRRSSESMRANSARPLTIPFTSIATLERPPDSARNGAARGAAAGAAVAGGLFGYALAVDRNEVDEWVAAYGGMAAVTIGIGALIGWVVDAARSKPHIRFGAGPEPTVGFSLRPVPSGGVGVALAIRLQQPGNRCVVSLAQPCPSTSSNERSPAPVR